MICPHCSKTNKCEKCSEAVKEVGRYDPRNQKVWCLDCFKEIHKEELKQKQAEAIVVTKVIKTGGGGSDKRKDADKFFEKTMSKIEGLGAGDRKLQDKNVNGRNEQIAHLQRQAQKAIDVKMADNRARGRTYNDGKIY